MIPGDGFKAVTKALDPDAKQSVVWPSTTLQAQEK